MPNISRGNASHSNTSHRGHLHVADRNVVVNATGGFGSGITLAIFVDVRASSEAVNLARGIQAEAKASGISLPLLEYDATKMSPFSVLEG